MEHSNKMNCELEGDGFVWQDYLDATETIEVPQIMFPHVELTLQSGIEIGMSLEVPITKDLIKNNDETSYWIATIVMACGPLLRLRYFGGDDRSLEFWFNLTKEAAHELGWSVRNNKKLEPPDDVLKRSPDCLEKMTEFLISAKSVPPEMLSGEELSMVDRIKQGMKVEVADTLHPYKLWIATIIENVGGRLSLRYDVPNSTDQSDKDMRLIFCTSESLYYCGFASETKQRWFLEPPNSLVDNYSSEEWKTLIETGLTKSKKTDNLFKNKQDHSEHNFQVGMKLETILPADKSKIMPATVIKVFDNIYFLVKVDDCANNQNLDDKRMWLCTHDHPYIFPIGWAKKNKLILTPPFNWNKNDQDFDWELYLNDTKSIAADESLFSSRDSAEEAGFEIGMRLEAVDPLNENIICAAHISKIKDNLLWLILDNYKNRDEHIVHMHSLQIFPVGWCESNHYPLKPPLDYVDVCKKLEKPEKEDSKKLILDIPILESRSSLWCPKIYFNYRCFTGPMISKGKLATLPKSVGPGPVTLVMREVLSMIVSVGYSSARILKVLQCDTKPDPGYRLEILKAKHKTNVYRANVAVITSGDMVAEFCRSICSKLMVCPNLFGPQEIEENQCPDKCYKPSKNKYSVYGSAKRGKQRGYTSILVPKSKPWGRRRRRKPQNSPVKTNKDKNENDNDNENEMEPENDNEIDDRDDDNDMGYLLMDMAKDNNTEEATFDGRQPLSEIDIMIEKDLRKNDKNDNKIEVTSSNASDDSRSSFNDRKSKDSYLDSSSSVNSKANLSKDNKKSKKRERQWDDSIESAVSDVETGNVHSQGSQRRPKTRKLDSNPLFWTVDDVFRYLRKTSDCKDIAYRVKQEQIDGLAFLLLNLPSLTAHMKLRTNVAMKLCRHVEQVKVTFFLRHLQENGTNN